MPAQTTALQIASLKKVSKSTKIILMDRNGGNARAVAKELSKKGYKSVCSVEGEFISTAHSSDINSGVMR